MAADDEEWYAATVVKTHMKTRTMSHTVDGAETLCREIFCDYDLDGDTRWHSLHNHDVRVCTTPSPVDESDTADPFPTDRRRLALASSCAVATYWVCRRSSSPPVGCCYLCTPPGPAADGGLHGK